MTSIFKQVEEPQDELFSPRRDQSGRLPQCVNTVPELESDRDSSNRKYL